MVDPLTTNPWAESLSACDIPRMSRCRIERTLRDPSATLENAKRETAKYGGIFEGDAVQGGHYRIQSPMGIIEGTYSLTGSVVCFEVSGKPAFVPCSLIATVIDRFLGKQ